MGCTHCSKFFYNEEQAQNANSTCRTKRRRRSPGVIRRIFSRNRNRVQPSPSETSSEASTTRGPPSGASSPVVPNYDIFCTDRTSRKSKSSCSSTIVQAIEQATTITETFTEKTRPEFEEEETSDTYKPTEVPEEAPEVPEEIPEEAQEEIPDEAQEEAPEEDIYESSHESQESDETEESEESEESAPAVRYQISVHIPLCRCTACRTGEEPETETEADLESENEQELEPRRLKRKKTASKRTRQFKSSFPCILGRKPEKKPALSKKERLRIRSLEMAYRVRVFMIVIHGFFNLGKCLLYYYTVYILRNVVHIAKECCLCGYFCRVL